VKAATITSANNVTQSFAITVTEDDLKGADAACEGVEGYVLGVKYKSTDLLHTNDVFAIVGSDQCGGGVFGGYVPEQIVGGDESTELKYAAACMVGRFDPKATNKTNSAFWQPVDSHLWSPSKLSGAISSGNLLKCDLKLSPTNAPGDPGKLPNKNEGTLTPPGFLPIMNKNASGAGFISCYGS
jgi:hypothetical protein